MKSQKITKKNVITCTRPKRFLDLLSLGTINAKYLKATNVYKLKQLESHIVSQSE